MMNKIRICLSLDKTIVDELKAIQDKTGIPVSRQVEMRLRGFKVVPETEDE